MVRALRVMTVERGVDPRGSRCSRSAARAACTRAAIADELGMTRILCPRATGVLSALGLAAADRRVDVQRTVLPGGELPTRRSPETGELAEGRASSSARGGRGARDADCATAGRRSS